MKIEVGKAYRTRSGKRANVTLEGLSVLYCYEGDVDGRPESWTRSGLQQTREESPNDLISPWEDSPTQIKSESNVIASAEDKALNWNNGGDGHSVPGPAPRRSESKMDVKVGDRVLVEAVVQRVGESGIKVEIDQTNGVWVTPMAIKSVEPAPPGVGDDFAFGDSQPRRVLAVAEGHTMYRIDGDVFCSSMETICNTPGFRIIKRAGGE